MDTTGQWPAERAEALLDRLADRVPADQLEQLREFNDVGEQGLLMDNLAAQLLQEQVPVSADEFVEVRDLLYWFPQLTKADRLHYVADRDNVLAALNVIRSAES